MVSVGNLPAVGILVSLPAVGKLGSLNNMVVNLPAVGKLVPCRLRLQVPSFLYPTPRLLRGTLGSMGGWPSAVGEPTSKYR